MNIPVLLSLACLSVPAFAADITAHIAGVENGEGRVRFAMFSQSREKHFPQETERAEYLVDAHVNDGQATVSIADVPAGTYAIFVYHDRNNNGTVDHKWYGPPAEAFAYYRRYEVKWMPPGFEEVSFDVGGADIDMDITLQMF